MVARVWAEACEEGSDEPSHRTIPGILRTYALTRFRNIVANQIKCKDNDVVRLKHATLYG